MAYNVVLNIITHGDTATRGITKVYKSLNKLNGAGKAFASFTKMSTTFFSMAAGAATAANSIISLSAALAPAAGIIAAMPAAMISLKTSLLTLKVATMGFGDAAKAAFTGDAKKFEESLKNLSPAARKVAKELNAMALQFKKLQQSVQNAFFAPLVGQLKSIGGNLLKPVKAGMTGLAGAFGQAAVKVSQFLREARTASFVKTVFSSTTIQVRNLTAGLKPLLEGMRDIALAGFPAMQKLSKGAGQVGVSIGQWLKNLAASGRVTEIIQAAVDVFKTLGNVIYQVAGILRSIFTAVSATGSNALGVISQMLEKVNAFLKTAEGQSALQSVFSGLAAIAKTLTPVLQALIVQIGGLAAPIGRLAMMIGPILLTAVNSLGPALQKLEPGFKAFFENLGKSVTILGPSLTKVGIAFSQVMVAVAPLLPVLAQLIVQVVDGLAPAITVLAPVVGVLAKALGAILLFIAPIIPTLVKLGIAFLLVAKALQVTVIVIDALKVAWLLLNYAWIISPIGVIVVAIIALGAAMVIAYKKSETFRNIVNAAWNGIKIAAMAAWNTVLKPVFELIKIYIGIVIAYYKMLWSIAKLVWAGIMVAVKIAWVGIKPIWEAIKIYINVLKFEFRILWAIVQVYWKAIVIAIKVAWVAIKVVWFAIRVYIALLMFQFKIFWAFVKLVWSGVTTAIRIAWNTGIKPIWNAIKTFLIGPFMTAFKNFLAAVKNIWNALRNHIRSVWENGIRPAFNGIKTALTNVKNAFQTAVTAIGRIWDTLKAKTRGPVSFIVNTVYMGGIRKVWEGLRGIVPGLPGMPSMHFAAGGVLPGYTPGRDPYTVPTYGFSGGEGVVRPEVTRVLTPSWVHGANKAAKTGGKKGVVKFLGKMGAPGGASRVQNFAGGGIIGGLKDALKKPIDYAKHAGSLFLSKGASWVAHRILDPILKMGAGAGPWGQAMTGLGKAGINGFLSLIKNVVDPNLGGGGTPGMRKALSFARGEAGKPYVWGGVGPGGYDCSGFMSALTNIIQGKSPYSRRFTTFSFGAGTVGPAGFIRDLNSGFRVGVTNAGVGHMAGTLLKQNVESSGSAGVRVGGAARGADNGLFSMRYGLRADNGRLSLRPGWNPPVYNGLGRMEHLSETTGNTYHIHNHNAAGSNPYLIGKATVDAIREFERRSGKGWRS